VVRISRTLRAGVGSRDFDALRDRVVVYHDKRSPAAELPLVEYTPVGMLQFWFAAGTTRSGSCNLRKNAATGRIGVVSNGPNLWRYRTRKRPRRTME